MIEQIGSKPWTGRLHTPYGDDGLPILSQIVGAIQHTLFLQQVMPVCLNDLLNTFGLHASNIIPDVGRRGKRLRTSREQRVIKKTDMMA